MEPENRKRDIIKSLIKWLVLLGLVAFAYVKNREFVHEAFTEVGHTPLYVLLLCFLLGNLYFLFEGYIISRMTEGSGVRVSLPQGIACGYMCEFYRLATLGNGSGIAQVYFYYTKGMSVPSALGVCISQYTFQKITIGIMGIAGFFVLLSIGNTELLQYAGSMALGAGMIAAICIFLFLIMVSKQISDAVMRIGRKLAGKKAWAHARLDKAQNAIDRLQNNARIVWGNKKLLITVILMDLAKQLSWYIIPGVVFMLSYGEKSSLFVFVCLMAVCNMLAGVMVAPSGIGTLDFVFFTFFGAIVPQAQAVAAVIILYRLFTWFLPFVFGFPVALLYRKKPEQGS